MAQVVCPKCGCKSEPRSTACWNCGAPRTDAWRSEIRSGMGTAVKVLLITVAIIAIGIGICFGALTASLGNLH